MSKPDPGATPFLPQLLNVAFDRVVRGLEEHLRAAGYDDLRTTHYLQVVRFLDRDGTRPSELARRAGMTPQAMGELVTHMEHRGYVERVPDPADGRARVVVWADRGRDAAAVADRYFSALQRDWTRKLGRQGMDSLIRSLSAVIDDPGIADPRLLDP